MWLSLGAFFFISTYEIVDLGTLGGDSSNALDINAAGYVTGGANHSSGVHHPYVWEPETGRMIDYFPDSYWGCEGWGINSHLQVAGLCYENGTFVAYLWTSRWWGRLETPAGVTATEGFSINDAGEVLGQVRISGGTPRPAVWSRGGMELLPLVSENYVFALGWRINQLGEVAGSFADETALPKPVLWRKDPNADCATGCYRAEVLPELKGTDFGEAWSSNEKGEIVGKVGASLWGTMFPAVWTKSLTGNRLNVRALKVPKGSFQGSASDINNEGQITGSITDEVFMPRAVVWMSPTASPTTLNDLLTPEARAEWYLIRANAINDSGWIVGYGARAGFPGYHAFLLRPKN